MRTGGTNRGTYAPSDEPLADESADQIDATFQAALALIRRRRTFTVDPHARRNLQSVTELPLSVYGQFQRTLKPYE